MTETLPTVPYSFDMVTDYVASVFSQEAVYGSVIVFVAVSLAVLTVRSIFRVERV